MADSFFSPDFWNCSSLLLDGGKNKLFKEACFDGDRERDSGAGGYL